MRNSADSSRSALRPWHWFVLSAAVPIVHCASRLNLDLWHDEIYTIDVFLRRGPAFIVSDYHLPNNHVLFSLVEWPLYFFSDNDFILRLPSFLFAVGTLAVVFRLAWRLCGPTCAVLSTALLGLNQMYLIFAIQVRGYSLSMLLAACLASLAAAPNSHRSWQHRIMVILAGAAFLYVLPTNVLFHVPFSLVAIVSTWRQTGFKEALRELLAWAAAASLALVCYLPILGQIRQVSASASRSSWSHLSVVAGNFFRPALHDFVWFAPFLLLGLWCWARRTRTGRQGEFATPSGTTGHGFTNSTTSHGWNMALLCSSVLVGAFLLTALLRVSPFERTYCPLLIILSLAGGWLLTEFLDSVRRRFAGKVSLDVIVAAALVVVSVALWPQLWSYPRRLEERRNAVNAAHKWPSDPGWPIVDGYYCYYAANYHPSAIVEYLLDHRVEQSGYRVCWTEVDHLNLWYAFAKAGLPSSNDPTSGDGRFRLFVIAPEPPAWSRLAKECGLNEDVIGSFRLVGDFGYYRLYQLDKQ